MVGEEVTAQWLKEKLSSFYLTGSHFFFVREVLKMEELEKKKLSHPANFGPKKYCLRECICEVEGQVPCPGIVPLPKEMTGKYKAALKASAQD